MLKKALLWTMLLISIVLPSKYNFMVLDVGDIVTNKGIMFDEKIVPDLLYDLSVHPILLNIKNAQKEKASIDEERINIRDIVITNIETKIQIQYKLDKAQKKKAIIVTAVITSVCTALVFLGLDVWISSLNN